MSAAVELIDAVVDEGSWESWDEPDVAESVLTGVGVVGGRVVVLVVSDFSFAGGSIGRAAGQRIAAAIDRATTDHLPVLAMPASGGTRMQEGTPAFLEMAVITAAVLRHRAACLPYLVYLRHPTTGGVFASWGSLGQVTWAEPGALIGFLGPKVFAGLHGEPFPDGVQRAEHLAAHGLVDDVVAPADLASRLRRVLDALARTLPAPRSVPEPVPAVTGSEPVSAWAAVEATRERSRPGLDDLLVDLEAVELARSGAVRVALIRAAGRPALLVGQDRTAQVAGTLIGAAALRAARRGIDLAAQWGLPLVTVIDTPGAELSVAAEESGLAAEIARCLAAMLTTPSPTLSVLLGQGAGGAALALFPADVTAAAPDAWLSPLPPEGASVIVHGDVDHAAELAGEQQVWARDLHRLGLVDVVGDDLASAVGRWLSDGPHPRPELRSRRSSTG